MSDMKNKMVARPPIIVVLGHVDHGKSTILDYIRKGNVVGSEAGGITQHISSYEVIHKDKEGKEKKITFLDTPGHAAFSSIRSRGTKAADIAILVVSAEDGVKPQTLEALECIKESNTPFIVAINKIDKPSANVEKTKQSLAENEIYVEGYGGDIPFIPVSASTGEGIDDLLDTLLLMAEIEEFKGSEDAKLEAVIIESNIDPQKGISAALVIKNGMLEIGDFVVAGSAYAPVRIIENFLGEKIEKASLSSPVRIIGWNNVPPVGEEVASVKTKKEAIALANECEAIKENNINEEIDEYTIPLIIKTDTVGSLDAVLKEIKKIENPKMTLKPIKSGVGQIGEEDIKLASCSEKSIVINFNCGIDANAQSLAERIGIEIASFSVIYKLTEWLEDAVSKLTPKEEVREETGLVKVLKIFNASKKNQIIGGKVVEGKVSVGETVIIKRRDNVIGEGKVSGLQSQKTEVKEVNEGNELGLMIETKIEIASGDTLHPFMVTEK